MQCLEPNITHRSGGTASLWDPHGNFGQKRNLFGKQEGDSSGSNLQDPCAQSFNTFLFCTYSVLSRLSCLLGVHP